MTTPTSIKFRAIGGASVLALTAGISGTALAQEPAPAPTAPSVPDDVEECTFEDGLVTCTPGLDPDGIEVIADGDSNDDDSDGDDSDTDEDGFGGDIGLDIQDGAYVADSVVLFGDVDGVVDGAIVVDGTNGSALLLGDGSSVTINGYIENSGDGAAGVEVGSGVSLVNNGTIYTTGDDLADGVVLGDGSTFTNSGLVRTDGAGSSAVFGGNEVTVENTADGSIVTTGDASAGIFLLNEASVSNAGTISTFGASSSGILVSEDSTVVSSGTIETFGDDAFGILAGDGSVINLVDGSVLTTEGDFAGGVVVDGTGEIEVDGLLSTSGLGAVAVFANGDESSVINMLESEIVTTGEGAAAIVLGNLAYVQNDGFILTSGDDAFGVEVGAVSLVVTNDSLVTEGDGAVAIFAGDSSRIFNSGTISTSGANAFGIVVGDEGIIETDSIISTTGDGATGIVAGNNIQILLESLHSLTTTGANANAIEFTGDVLRFENYAEIAATGEGSTAILWGGSGALNNFAGGSITGEIGIDGTAEDTERQVIANFGSITGTGGNAVLFGGGDDAFQQWDTASLDGLVDGGDGFDSLIFGNASEEDISRDLGDIDDGENFDNFERFGFLTTGAGVINLTGETDQVLSVLGGNIVLSGSTTNTVVAEGEGSLLVTDTGSIAVEDDVAVDVDANDFTIFNEGSITSGGAFAIDGTDALRLTVNNSGEITTTAPGSIAIYGENLDPDSDELALTVNNSGTIAGGEGGLAITILGNGVVNNLAEGLILSEGDDSGAVFIAGTGVVDNDGTISSTGDNSITLTLGGEASLDNSGDITAEGDGATAVVLVAGGDVVNSGTISGATGIDASFDVASSRVVNFGSIIGTDGNAALLGAGDDEFQIFNDSSVDGLVDGGDGTDRLVFGNIGDDVFTIDISGIDAALDGDDSDDDDDSDDSDADVDDIDANYVNFENVGFRDLGGGINLVGEADRSFSVLEGSVTLSGSLFDTLVIDGESVFTVADTGLISVDGAPGILVAADNAGIVNNGTIEAVGAFAVDATMVTGLDLANTGTIQAADAHAIALNQGDITNSGLIEALSTADDMDGGDGTDGDGTDGDDSDGGDMDVDTPDVDDRTLLAAISFEGEAEAESTVTNGVDGVIRGEIGILAYADDSDDTDGGTDDHDSDDSDSDDMDGDDMGDELDVTNRQVVANFGTIEGTGGDAVLLGDGSDEFQQWTGASVIGDIELEDGDDRFILEGRLTSVDGEIDGGDGDDTVILAGILDRDDVFEDSIFENFENFQLGSTLGTAENGLLSLNDLVVEGNRQLENDFTIVGEVIFDLGEDSLTTDGTITLAETGLITVNTPLDQALVGQTVVVLEGDDTEDLGGTIDIIDDDLLLAYTPVGLLSVTVEGDNPVFDDRDRNIRVFGDALADAVDADTLDDDTFDAFNDLDSIDAFRAAAADALPSLSEGVAREIFETASAASQAIAHPHATEGASVWGQFIYRGAEQDAREISTDGYESDQLIFTAGVDFVPLDSFSLGVIGSYADIENDDVNRAGAVRGTTDIESIKVGAYASATLFGAGFVNAELSYLTGDVEENRNGFLGDINSEFDFDGYFARAEFGIDLAGADNVGIIPTFGVHHANIDFDDAVETGGFGFGIERGDAKFTELRGGLEINGDVSSMIEAFAKATYIHDLEDSPRSFRLTSNELSPFLLHLPLREQDRFETAAGVMFGLSEGFGLEVGYLGDFADGYNAHSARANLRITF